MTVMLDSASIRAVTHGTLVSRATAALPATTDEALFTITGGRIRVVSLIGEVTTVIETQANNTKLKFNPTATGADQDLCAVLDITADAVGTLYTISGTVGDAMRDDLLIGNGDLTNTLVLSEGDIELDCAATNTGSVAWDLVYTAIDTGATVAAA
jgi:hypothetical protein